MCDGKQQTEQGTIKGIAPCSARPFTPWLEFPRTALISAFSCLLTSQHNFIGTPQGLSYSITCNGGSFRQRETLHGCDSRSILISFQYQLQLWIAALYSKYFESENSPKEKMLCGSQPWKGQAAAPGLGIWAQCCSHPDCPREEGGICRCCQGPGIFASLLGAYDLGSLKFQPPETNSSWLKTKIFNCFCIKYSLSGVEAEEAGNDSDLTSDEKNKDVLNDIDMNNISTFSP